MDTARIPAVWKNSSLASFSAAGGASISAKGVPATPDADGPVFVPAGDTVEAAIEMAWARSAATSVGSGHPVAVGVLQAGDGAYFVANLGTGSGAGSSRLYFDNPNRTPWRVQPLLDDLLAVVGASRTIRFDQA